MMRAGGGMGGFGEMKLERWREGASAGVERET
jgi:hypothetical protein